MQLQSVNNIWAKITAEIKQQSLQEPMLASFYHATILNHKGLSESLSFILANKLGSSVMPPIVLREIIREAFTQSTQVLPFIADDIKAVLERDPATDFWSTPMLYLKGFQALQSYRVTHYLWQNGRQSLALFLQNEIATTFNIDIHPAAEIGYGIMLDHGTGIVIGETSRVGNNVSILQGVTLGGTGKETDDRHPKVGKGVLIGAGAKILGNINIGDYSKIGAGSVVLKSVPCHCTVAGVPAKIVSERCKEAIPAADMNQFFD